MLVCTPRRGHGNLAGVEEVPVVRRLLQRLPAPDQTRHLRVPGSAHLQPSRRRRDPPRSGRRRLRTDRRTGRMPRRALRRAGSPETPGIPSRPPLHPACCQLVTIERRRRRGLRPSRGHRVADHRSRLRRWGLRPPKIWVPDVLAPGCADEAGVRRSRQVVLFCRSSLNGPFRLPLGCRPLPRSTGYR